MLRPTARVAQIPYLNVAPFLLHWDELSTASEGRWSAVEAVPRQLGEAAAAGEVDAGIFALADLVRLGGEFEPLIAPEVAPAGLGIACRHRVDSVLLFGRTAPEPGAAERPSIVPAAPPPAAEEPLAGRDAMAEPVARTLAPREARALHDRVVAVTGESSTSVRLLRILLEVRHAVRPACYVRREIGDEAIDPRAAAVLSIGDEALRWRRRPPAGFRLVADLAAEWGAWTGLPFVFAVWGVRRSLPQESRSWLARFLARSLTTAEAILPDREAAIAAFRLDRHAGLGPPDELLAYLRHLTFRLGAEERVAMARFGAYLQPILDEGRTAGATDRRPNPHDAGAPPSVGGGSGSR